jgi:hypothetical protein
MSKRHQASRRRSYGRRQHEVAERGDRRERGTAQSGWAETWNDASPAGEMDALGFLGSSRGRATFGFAD